MTIKWSDDYIKFMFFLQIEKHAAHILEEEGKNQDQPRLTPEELQYAQE